MSDLIRLSLTTVNAPDAIALARFYAEITGGVAKGDAHWAAVAGVLTAGATLLDFQPNPDHCFVYADPAGHPFCLSTWHSRGLSTARSVEAPHEARSVIGLSGRCPLNEFGSRISETRRSVPSAAGTISYR